MKRPRGLTLIDLMVAVGVLAILVTLLVIALRVPPEDTCRNNQKLLLLGLILYRDNQGRAVEFPAADGSDFLLALYVSDIMHEPELLLCPATKDDNDQGAAIAYGNSAATSYAGRRNRDQTRYPGLYTSRGSSETPISSDDDEDGPPFVHDGAIVVGFADGHVELLPRGARRLQGATRVGEGLLDPLAN